MLVIVLLASPFLGEFGETADVTTSTVQRQPLPAGSVNETGYYTDNLDWIQNQTKLVSGLRHFYKQTGVQPYLYITDTINGSHSPSAEEIDAFANELYDQLFTDEAHLLFVFFEYDNRYIDRYLCGTQAKTVVDQEAADILLDFVDRYYYDDSLSEDEFFSQSFSEAADRMMTVTRSPWVSALVFDGAVVLVVVAFLWWRNSKRQRNLEAKRTEELLKIPLDRFGDPAVEELAKKYEDENKTE